MTTLELEIKIAESSSIAECFYTKNSLFGLANCLHQKGEICLSGRGKLVSPVSANI